MPGLLLCAALSVQMSTCFSCQLFQAALSSSLHTQTCMTCTTVARNQIPVCTTSAWVVQELSGRPTLTRMLQPAPHDVLPLRLTTAPLSPGTRPYFITRSALKGMLAGMCILLIPDRCCCCVKQSFHSYMSKTCVRHTCHRSEQ